jgi:hypothetical protein
MKKTKAKRAIAKSRVIPEIYIKCHETNGFVRSIFAKAKIRIRGGEYQYLQWREAGKVRSLYLGRKRQS